jgi:hypothetical protein
MLCAHDDERLSRTRLRGLNFEQEAAHDRLIVSIVLSGFSAKAGALSQRNANPENRKREQPRAVVLYASLKQAEEETAPE